MGELLARIEQLEAGRQPRPRRRRFLIVAAIAIGLLAAPVGAFASHQFTDVPNSHTFHTAISRLKGAGITAGCSATKYCPGNPVTRGSMSAFLTRAAGRASGKVMTALIDDADAEATLIGTITIKAGDLTGGTANVHLNASMYAYTVGIGGCPCGAVFYFAEAGESLDLGNYASLTDLVFGGGGIALDSLPLTTVVGVPTGVTKTFQVYGLVIEGAQDVSAFAEVTATYFPFTASGANPSLTSTTSSGVVRPDWAQ